MEFEEAMVVRAEAQQEAREEARRRLEANVTKNPVRVALESLEALLESLEDRLGAIEEKLDELLDVARIQGIADHAEYDDDMGNWSPGGIYS